VIRDSCGEPFGIRNFLSETILSVVDYSDASVRLRNVLINAGPHDPFSTVREYLAAGSGEASSRFKRKSARSVSVLLICRPKFNSGDRRTPLGSSREAAEFTNCGEYYFRQCDKE
jgi:hypothetical protein